jgi:hypothetical protein
MAGVYFNERPHDCRASSLMKGYISGTRQDSTALAKAGPTPFRRVKSMRAFLGLVRARVKDSAERDWTCSAALDSTNCLRGRHTPRSIFHSTILTSCVGLIAPCACSLGPRVLCTQPSRWRRRLPASSVFCVQFQPPQSSLLWTRLPVTFVLQLV